MSRTGTVVIRSGHQGEPAVTAGRRSGHTSRAEGRSLAATEPADCPWGHLQIHRVIRRPRPASLGRGLANKRSTMRHAETRNGARAAATRLRHPPSPRMLKHSLREKVKLLLKNPGQTDPRPGDGGRRPHRGRRRPAGMALHTLAACRGAINALMAEILEDHIRYYVAMPGRRSQFEQKAWPPNNWWIIVKSYLR